MKSKFLHDKREELLASKSRSKQPEKEFKFSELPEESRKTYDDAYSESELKAIDKEIIDLVTRLRGLQEMVSKFSDNSRRKRLRSVAREFDLSKLLGVLSNSESVIRNERKKILTLINDRERILSVYASDLSRV